MPTSNIAGKIDIPGDAVMALEMATSHQKCESSEKKNRTRWCQEIMEKKEENDVMYSAKMLT